MPRIDQIGIKSKRDLADAYVILLEKKSPHPRVPARRLLNSRSVSNTPRERESKPRQELIDRWARTCGGATTSA